MQIQLLDPVSVRDRIEVAGVWLIVYPDGRHLRVHGIACDREANPSNQQFGTKAFTALLMTATMQTGAAVAASTVYHCFRA